MESNKGHLEFDSVKLFPNVVVNKILQDPSVLENCKKKTWMNEEFQPWSTFY